MGTTTLAVIGLFPYVLVDLIRQFRRSGLRGLGEHWGERLKHTTLVAVCWWATLFSYHLFYKIPREIN
jgi:hypothetical protein